MNRRVTVFSEVKPKRGEAEAKASVKSAKKLNAVDPKPSELAMSRLKCG